MKSVLALAALGYAVAGPATLKSFLDKLDEKTNTYKVVPDTYADLALRNPRNFTTIVLYTASNPQFGCGICATGLKEFQIAASSYAAATPLEKRDIIFSVADFDQSLAKDVFLVHGFTNVPHVAVFPKSDKKRRFSKGQQFDIPKELISSPGEGVVGAKAVLRMAMQTEDIPFTIVRPAEERYKWAAWAAAAVALFGALLVADRGNLLFWNKQWFWVTSAMLVFFVAVSGFLKCIISGNVPWYGKGKDGKPILFSTSSSDQYILEGGAIGLLNVIAGLGVILLVTAAKTPCRSTLVKLALGIVAVALFACCYMQITTVYITKNSWWKPSELAPSIMTAYAQSRYRRATKWLLGLVNANALTASAFEGVQALWKSALEVARVPK